MSSRDSPTPPSDPEWVDKGGVPFPFSRKDYNMFFFLDHPEKPNDNLDRLAQGEMNPTNDPEEDVLEVLPDTGALPEDLVGTYFLNGPSLVKIGGKVVHPFDGHGFLRRITIDGPSNSATLKCGVVGTEAFRTERDAKKVVFRGLGSLPADPSSLSGRWTNLSSPMNKNVANTCVVRWGETLLCLWEGGLPHKVSETNFADAAPFDFHGALPSTSTIQFLAHTCTDRVHNKLVGLALTQGRGTTYTFYEFDQKYNLCTKVTFQSSRGSFVHDFLITEHFYVIVESPIKLKLGALATFLTGGGPMVNAVAVDDTKNCFVSLVPRDASRGPGRLDPDAPPVDVTDQTRQVDIGQPLSSFHQANAYELLTGDGRHQVVLVAAGFPHYTFGNEFGFSEGTADYIPSRANGGAKSRQTLWKITIDVKPGAADAAINSAVALEDEMGLDFISVHPTLKGQQARYVYASGSDYAAGFPFNIIVRIDIVTGKRSVWRCPPRCFVGEAILAPRASEPTHEDGDLESHGWLLCCAYDAEAAVTKLLVLDPRAIEDGPIAQISLGRALPFGFHGNWEGAPFANGSTRSRL